MVSNCCAHHLVQDWISPSIQLEKWEIQLVCEWWDLSLGEGDSPGEKQQIVQSLSHGSPVGFMAWQKSNGTELKCSYWYFYMEKRKWDVNSISVIQFSCEIKRKARIWEIWKLQLQDKWYLKGSYLIWLNWSSNVTREMHYLQVFQSFCWCIPRRAHIRPGQGCGGVTGWRGLRLGGKLGAAQRWERVLPCGHCAPGFGWGFQGPLIVVPQKKCICCRILFSGWRCLDRATSWPLNGNENSNLLLLLWAFGFHSVYLGCGEVVPSGGECLTDNNVAKAYILCPAFVHTGLVSLAWPWGDFCNVTSLFKPKFCSWGSGLSTDFKAIWEEGAW